MGGEAVPGDTDPEVDRTARALGRGDPAVEAYRLELRQGQVTAVDTPNGKVAVALGGDPTSIPGVKHLSNYRPVVGDTVWALVVGPDLMVLDRPAQSWDGPGKHEWADDGSGTPDVNSGSVSSVVDITSWPTQTVNGGIATRSGAAFTLNRAGWWSVVFQLKTDAGLRGVMSMWLQWPSGAFANQFLVDRSWRGDGFSNAGGLEQTVSWSGYVSPAQATQPMYTRVRWQAADGSTKTSVQTKSVQLDFIGGGIA